MRRWLFLLVVAMMASSAVALERYSDSFPLPDALKPDVRFWTRIYSEITTQQGLIHDRTHLNVVYEILDLPPGSSAKQNDILIKKRKKYYEELLMDLAAGGNKATTDEHQRVARLWPKDTDAKTFKAASEEVRFQLGQADRFREGVIRSGRWLPYIHGQFSEMGLPLELAALPHVESSFQNDAHSHAGASGMWQFTRGTGRRFLRIDHVVDERLDPFEATRAAGQLLQENYEKTGTWPLALTAYNHGAAGMQRAIAETGGTDLVKILREYKGRTFGFASRNFYNAFMAAYTIDQAPEEYFGPIQRAEPVEVDFIELPSYYTAESLEKAFGLQSNIIKSMNPALQDSVWRKHKLVPKGYQLRLPAESINGPPSLLLSQVPESERSQEQFPDRVYRVQRGDALSSIASRFRVSMQDLVEANNLRSQNQIRIGQLLKIPAKSVSKPVARYTVQRGDTLEKIARRTRVSQAQLMALNNLKNQDKIFVGQRLRLH